MARTDLAFSETQRRAADSSRTKGRGFCEIPALFLKSIDEEKRQIRVLASSSALDRHGERILPEAFRDSLDVFMENPVVLAAHNHRLDDGSPAVIGRVIRIWIDKAGLWAVIEFAETELGEKYWQLYVRGFMRGVSVGFVPKKGEYIAEENVRLYVHTRVELLEISCVPIPSNPEALMKDTGKRNTWLDGKRAEREEAKIMRDIYIEHPEFDVDCSEFAEMLLCGDLSGCCGVEDRTERRENSGIIEAGIFVRAVSGKPADRLADLVGRRK